MIVARYKPSAFTGFPWRAPLTDATTTNTATVADFNHMIPTLIGPYKCIEQEVTFK